MGGASPPLYKAVRRCGKSSARTVCVERPRFRACCAHVLDGRHPCDTSTRVGNSAARNYGPMCSGDFGQQRQLQILAACRAPAANPGRSPSSRAWLQPASPLPKQALQHFTSLSPPASSPPSPRRGQRAPGPVPRPVPSLGRGFLFLHLVGFEVPGCSVSSSGGTISFRTRANQVEWFLRVERREIQADVISRSKTGEKSRGG